MPPGTQNRPLRFGLKGQIVTMDAGKVLESGVVYVANDNTNAGNGMVGTIAAVLEAGEPPPAGFEDAPVIDTKGSIYPGLIELHNHLCYNLLTLWQVPKQYEHRDQWPNHPDYLRLITGPIRTLGASLAATYLPSIVRYVEAKCLMGGVTSSQGLTLNGTNTVAEFRGNVRNVESTGIKALPSANPRIGDVKPGEADAFLARLKKSSCALLHLSEGRQANSTALAKFDRLRLANGSDWAITPALVGIHSAALRKAEFEIMHAHGASIVWSPLSNLLLYGTTADVELAKRIGLRIALGSDWSPTGSKNLLGELKVAKLYSQNNGGIFSDKELVELCTTNAASMLGWQSKLGRIKHGYFADLVVSQHSGGADPYTRLVESTESDITLVMIGGHARYGRRTLMKKLADNCENWTLGSKQQAFKFETTSNDNPIIVTTPLKDAQTLLRDAMKRMPEIAANAPPGGDGGFLGSAPGSAGATTTGWRLSIDDDTDSAFFASAGANTPFKDVAVSLELDPLTIIEDKNYFMRLSTQLPHVPDYIRTGLAKFYP